jgi:hypothetical protein
LCVPEIHRVVVRNWNRASSGCSRTAPIVANRPAVSTPLSRAGSVVVLDVVVLDMAVLLAVVVFS